MNDKKQILLTVKSKVLEVLSGTEVILFGSRANDTANAESDWDILVLSPQQPITKEIKLQVHNKIFPLSVSIGAFINMLLVTKKDWQQNPSYYSLQQTVALNNKPL